MKRAWVCIAIVVLCAVSEAQSPQEQAVWKLEHDYWEYVKSFDLEHYRALWHSDFVGWPQSSATPARKANITDWVVAHRGESLTYQLEPAASQAFGDNLVITHYWVTTAWAGKGQTVPPGKSRITHTWLRTSDRWQIIGGMSAPAVDPVARP